MALLLLLFAIIGLFVGSGASSSPAVSPPKAAAPATCVTVTWWRTAPGEKKPCLVPGKPLKVRIYSDASR